MRAQVNLYKDMDMIEVAQAKQAARSKQAARAAAAAAMSVDTPAAGGGAAVDVGTGGASGVAINKGARAAVDSDDEDETELGGIDDDGDDDDDGDFPDVGLEELLDDLALGADEDGDGELAGSSGTTNEISPVTFAPPVAPVPQFTLPEGNDAKFFF